MSIFTQNLKRFKLITFDVTDTVLKFTNPPPIEYGKVISSFGYKNIKKENMEKAFKEAFKYMLMHHPNFGKATNVHYLDWWHMLIYRVLDFVQLNVKQTDATRIANVLINKYSTSDCWIKVKVVDELVTKIYEEDKMIGIISNFDPSLKAVLDSVNFPKMDFVLTSYEAGFSKPDPLIFQKALRYGKCTADEALHIGNTPLLDYVGAIKSGWSSALITNNTDDWKNYPEINKNHVFSNLNELLHKLENDLVKW